jgi:hypothetical protein
MRFRVNELHNGHVIAWEVDLVESQGSHMRFMMDEMTLGHVFLYALWFSAPITICLNAAYFWL